MKVRKTRSVKQASFFGMLGGSLAFTFINFLIFSIFILSLGYTFIGSQEHNLSNILIENLTEKQQRVAGVSNSISTMLSDEAENKNIFLERYVHGAEEIQGILILDEQGIIKDTTEDYKEYKGMDFSGKDYYDQIMTFQQKSTMISNSYVSHKTKKVSLSVVSPVVKNDRITGMVVILINPSIIENSALKGLDYYLVGSNGDIIFRSSEGNIKLNEDNIKDSAILQKGLGKLNPIIYRDRLNNKLVLGIVRQEPMTSMYVVLQHHIFGSKAIVNGLFLVLLLGAGFIFIFILLFSSQASKEVTNYVNIFNSELKKISIGNYDVGLGDRYPYYEINEIINSFSNMALKVKQREEELQAYNEELIAANDEIKTMLDALNKTEKDRKEQYIQIIWTMVNLLEIKDEYTAGHSKSVTYYTEQIALKLNKDYGFNIDLERIQIAAILHDIGKIGIDKEILNKPSRLTQEEYQIIKTHPSKGYYALKAIESLKEERRIIKYHHERYDGKGYPEGIKGDVIPLGARIICVADAFDAMISDRPYRRGMPIEFAINELTKNKGIQFDPLIVDVFVSMLMEESREKEKEA